jgi:hypothetical protein
VEFELETICPYCGRRNELHAEATGPDGRAPKPGDVTICWGCVGVCIFDENMALRLPTDEEFEDVHKVAAPLQALMHHMKDVQERAE